LNEFGKALDEGKEIRVVFCDISKAFDRVWDIGLLKKLESIGIQGPLLSWIKNSFIVDCISVTMSFIKNINKRGTSIEPWGTPALISRHWELELFITTLCFLFDK
jgi:hypothetical protein